MSGRKVQGHESERHAVEQLGSALERLVARQVLTEGQAQAVIDEVAVAAPARRISPAAEIAAYVGGILATVAAITVVSRFWIDIPALQQVLIFAVVSFALWFAGRSVRAVEDPAAQRLTSALWLMSTAAAASAAWVTGDDILRLNETETSLFVGLVSAAHGTLLWLRHRTSVQQLVIFAAVLATGGAGIAIGDSPPEEIWGIAVWALGVVWALLGVSGVMRPVTTAAAVGAVTAVIGAEVLAVVSATPGLLLGLATVSVLFAAGAASKQPVFLGVGSVGLAIVLPHAMTEWFPSSVTAPLAMFVAGVILLGGALVTIRTARQRTPLSPQAG